MTWRRIMACDDLWPGEMVGLEVGGTPVLLVHVDDGIVAFEDACAHQRRRLSEGRLDRGVLTCAAHDWQYDAASGRGLNPRSACLRRFAVKLEAGDIWVDLAAASGGEDHVG